MQLIDGLKPHLTTLRLYGIFGNFDSIYMVYSVLFLSLFYMPYLLFELGIFFENIAHVDRVGDSYLVFSHLSTTFKFLTIMVNQKNVSSILDQMNSIEFNPYVANHKNLLQIQIKQIRNLFKYFFAVANVTIFYMLVMPIIITATNENTPKLNESYVELMDRKTLPLDWSNEHFNILVPPVYGIAYFGQIQLIIIACHVCVAIDCLVSGVLHMVATQFDILGIEMQKLGNKDTPCDEAQREMKKCIFHHIKLFSLTDQVSETFNGIYLSQCCVTSIILCITAIQMSRVSVIEFVPLLSYLLCVIFELYLFCHYGNKIFIKTGDILPAIYHSNWYLRECKCSYKLQRKHLKSYRQGIQIMLVRATQATNLSAAKLFHLNYATFVTILKSGYSFYAVLNSAK